MLSIEIIQRFYRQQENYNTETTLCKIGLFYTANITRLLSQLLDAIIIIVLSTMTFSRQTD